MEQELHNSFLADLLDFVNEEEEQLLGIGDNTEGFMIESADQANYFARKLREVRAEKNTIEQTAAAQIDAYKLRVEQWASKNTAPLAYEENRLVNMLEVFAARQLDGSSKKSIKLVEGTLQFRAQQASIEYTEDVLLDHVEKNYPQYVKTKNSVDKAELKKAFSVKDGKAYINDQVIPGISVEARMDKFDVK